MANEDRPGPSDHERRPGTAALHRAGRPGGGHPLSPIVVRALFSEPVAGFTGSDVSFGGSTAGGTLVAAVTGGPTTYTVAVTGMTTAGVVRASVPANAAADPAGDLSTASTSADNAVTWQGGDTTAPTCAITDVRRPGPSGRAEMDVTIADTGSGLHALTNLVITNGVASVTPVRPGRHARRPHCGQVRPNLATRFSFDVVDRAGNGKHCA